MPQAIIPFIPLIASGVGAAGSIAGGALANRGGGGSSGTTQQGKDISDLFGDVRGHADQQFGVAQKDHKAFRKSLDPVSDFFKSILGGDRSKLMEVLGPEVQTINRGYDAVSNAIAEFSPRGSGRTSEMADVGFKKTHDISDLFAKARPAAAQGLEGVASLYGGQSANEESTAMGGLSTALSAALGLRAQDLQKAFQTRAGAMDLGRSLGSLLMQFLHPGSSSGGGIQAGPPASMVSTYP